MLKANGFIIIAAIVSCGLGEGLSILLQNLPAIIDYLTKSPWFLLRKYF